MITFGMTSICRIGHESPGTQAYAMKIVLCGLLVNVPSFTLAPGDYLEDLRSSRCPQTPAVR